MNRTFSMRRYIIFCDAGKIFIAITLLLGGVAIFTGNNLLYFTTAVLLGVLLASGIVGYRNIRSSQLTLRLPEEIYAGLPCPVSITIDNKSRRGAIFLIEVTLRGKRLLFSCIQPGQSATQTFFATFPQRGVSLLEDIELFSVYPFNFFIRYFPYDLPPIATVFPHPIRCNADLIFAREDEGEEGRPTPSLDTDIIGVRPYVEGDPMKQVHWKSSARTGSLKTRLYERETGINGQVIDLDRLLEGGTEMALSMACHVLMESIKTRVPVGMKHGELFFPPDTSQRHKLELLTLLAHYSE